MRSFVYVQEFINGAGGRRTTVQFRCQPDEVFGKRKIKSTKAELKSIKEDEALVYDVILSTSALCVETLDKLVGGKKGTVSLKETNHMDPLLHALLLLQPLEEKCIDHHYGWWSYKVCYMGALTQYHVEQQQKQQTESEIKAGAKPQFEQVTKVEYTLGSWELSQHWSEYEASDEIFTSQFELHNGSTPEESFLSLKYSGGTKCDLTGQPREAAIKFKCDEEAKLPRVVTIQETATCQYEVVIQTSLICSHPAFKIQHPETLQIRCAALEDDDEDDEEEGDQNEEEEQPISGEGSTNNDDDKDEL
eukprot:TRINITY_DN5158_c0_g1_i2.p1 TRINITY_DN5158_c0_g1~~TRINITY_DN5158_c0_g1_i2.p1  ORF type:complete len:305 (-),score=73.45 TRINITY_DN5158_c0_g1_i2:56-970(-)